MDVVFAAMVVSVYLFCLVSICVLSFQKGHMLLGFVGFVIPVLWLIGALLPARPGSRHAVKRETYKRGQIS